MAVRISIIMPTYNRGDCIEASLRAYMNQTVPKDNFEIIVIDDGSTDGTRDLLERLKKELNYSLSIYRQNNRGSGAARNTGVRHAKGEIILNVDDDALPVPNFVEEHLKIHDMDPNLIVRGPIINVDKPEIRDSEPFLWRHFSMNYFCTANVSTRKEHIFKAGFFDERFHRRQDAELGLRLRKLGLKRKFSVKAIVYHYKPLPDIETICKSALVEGKSSALLYHTHRNWRMMFHMGAYPLNYFQGAVFSNKIMADFYKKVLKLPFGDKIPFVSGTIRKFMSNHYYLKSVRDELKRLQEEDNNKMQVIVDGRN